MPGAAWRWVSDGWDLFAHAWAAFALTGFAIVALGIVLAAALRWFRDPNYRAVVRARRAAKRTAFRARPRLSRILLRFISVWCGLVAIINLAAVCELFRESGAINGFLRVQ